MKKIGLSQRVEVNRAYDERRDCLDQRWSLLLNKLKYFPIPIPNRVTSFPQDIYFASLSGFILTGGNDLSNLAEAVNSAPERDDTERAILSYARDNKLPVLGVCRGFQMMNVYLGGFLRPVKNHSGRHHKVHSNQTDPFFNRFAEVNSYHCWGITEADISSKLKALSYADDKTIEVACHINLPWLGIMWHPEREVPFNLTDLDLLDRLFGGC